jgi:hypothetical protein
MGSYVYCALKEIREHITAHLFATIVDKTMSNSVSFEAQFLEVIIKYNDRLHGSKCGGWDIPVCVWSFSSKSWPWL